MRICHTVDSGGIYGKENMVLALAKEQLDAGHHVEVMVTGRRDFYDLLLKNSISAWFLSSIRHAPKCIEGMDYDIVHTHDYKSGIFLSASKLFRRLKPKLIRTIHGYTDKGTLWFSKIRLYTLLDKLFTNFNDKTIAVSRQLASELDVSHVDNGIAPFDPNQKKIDNDIRDWCEDSNVLICMARLSPEKNLANLIKAVNNLDNTKLLMFGDGPLMDDLKTLNVENKIKFMGFDVDAKHYLILAKAYIQPSLTEGMPISILEAMSAGIPLIVSEVGGMKNLIGLDVAYRCPLDESGIQTIVNVVMKNQERREFKALKAKKLFNSSYSSANMHEEYQKIYQQLR